MLGLLMAGLNLSLHANILNVGPGGYESIQGAIDVAAAGDTIEVAAGVYSETLAVNKANLKLVSVGEVKINPDTVAKDKPVVSITADGVVFDGFEVTSTSLNKVLGIIVEAKNVVVKNSCIHDLEGVLIRPRGADNLKIESCTLYNSAGFGINPNSKSDSVTVKGCYIAGTRGIYINHGSNWIIDSNYIAGRHSWGEGVVFPFQTASLGITLDSGGGHTAINNVIVGVTEAGIKLESDNCTVANNTIAFCFDWASTYSIPMVLQPHVVGNGFGIRFKSVSNATVVNNNLAYNYRGIGVYAGYNGPDANSIVAYNNIYGGHIAGLDALGYTQGEDWINQADKTPVDGFNWDPLLIDINPNWQADNISVDPMFASLDPFDYKLLSESGCIDVGSNEYAPDIDIVGTERPQDGHKSGESVADIGAYEYVYQMPAIVYVDDDFTAEDSGAYVWGYNAFDNMQDAIDGVAAGGTVSVAAGEYTVDSQIKVEKELNVVGDSESLPVIRAVADFESDYMVYVEGKSSFSNIAFDGNGYQVIGALRLLADQSSVKSCSFANIRKGAYDGHAVVSLANGVEVSESTFSNIGRVGIFIGGKDNIVSGNTYTGKGEGDQLDYGIEVGGSNCGSAEIFNNTITGCAGIQSGASPSAAIFVSSYFASGDNFSAATIYDNTLSGSYFGVTVGYNASDQSEVEVRHNLLAGNVVGVANYGGKISESAYNWWGDAGGPYNEDLLPDGTGSEAYLNVNFNPWYEDEALTILRYLGGADVDFGGEMIIGRGEVVTIPETLNAGQEGAPATIRVLGGTLQVGQLTLSDESVVEVVDGKLVLGSGEDAHTISGSFTIYNSFGSVYIAADTEFSGSTLALISDIHVADGVTLSVSGSLIWDGCTVDCADEGGPIADGSFNLEVASGSSFTLIRCYVTGAQIVLQGSGAEIRDNNFVESSITVESGASDNRVFHNILAEDALSDNGAGTVTAVDGWANVTTWDEVANVLATALSQVDGGSGTLADDGNYYIKSGGEIKVNLDVASLNRKVSSTVAMLGFNTEYFDVAATELTPTPPWLHGLVTNDISSSGVYGKINTAIGLSVEYGDEFGTDQNGTTATITLTSREDAPEGVTRFYFRLWEEGENPRATTHLSGFDGEDDYILTPFTRNSGYIVVDNTPPESGGLAVTQERQSEIVDLLEPDSEAYQGTVLISVAAQDAVAGIDGNDAQVTITLRDSEPPVTLVATFVGSEVIVTEEGEEGEEVEPDEFEGWTRYTFAVEIDGLTPNGTYDISVVILDQAGNPSEQPLTGAFDVQKNQITATVALQGAVEGPFTRTVTFVATDATGNELETWSSMVEFTNGVGVATFPVPPETIAGLSAKTGHTLRRKLTVAFDENGQIIAQFVGEAQLLGGDLNGDNVVDDLDFNRLRQHWHTNNTLADINGDGVSNTADLNIMRTNFNGQGDEE